MEDSTNIGQRGPHGRSIGSALHALEKTGFRLLAHKDLADSDKTCIIPWYLHLAELVGNPCWSFINAPQHTSQYSLELTRDAASILLQAGIFKVGRWSFLKTCHEIE